MTRERKIERWFYYDSIYDRKLKEKDSVEKKLCCQNCQRTDIDSLIINVLHEVKIELAEIREYLEDKNEDKKRKSSKEEA